MREIKLRMTKDRKFGVCTSCRKPGAISPDELCEQCSSGPLNELSVEEEAALVRAFGDLYD